MNREEPPNTDEECDPSDIRKSVLNGHTDTPL